MENLFLLLFLFSIGGILTGIISPRLALFWNKPKASRKKVFKIYPLILVVSFIMFGITAPTDPASEASESQEQTEQSTTSNSDQSKKDTETSPTKAQKEKPEQTSPSDSTSDDESKTSNQEKNDDQAASKEHADSGENEGKQEQQETEEKPDPSDKQDNRVEATVTRVVDGDTVNIRLNGQEETVRLLLVDTPETKHPSKPVQKYGPEASTFAKSLLSGKSIEIEYDGPKRDKYDRLLGYIWVDGKNFNKLLLQKGLARYAYVYDPPYTHAKSFKQAERSAQDQNLRIWKHEGYVQQDGFHQEVFEPKEQQSTSGNLPYDPNGPDRDCSDFDSQEQAQAFFEAAGGPESDPHRLDGHDDDGLVCESL